MHIKISLHCTILINSLKIYSSATIITEIKEFRSEEKKITSMRPTNTVAKAIRINRDLADLFTKSLHAVTFRKCVRGIGMRHLRDLQG
jgi:hypothetical protein